MHMNVRCWGWRHQGTGVNGIKILVCFVKTCISQGFLPLNESVHRDLTITSTSFLDGCWCTGPTLISSLVCVEKWSGSWAWTTPAWIATGISFWMKSYTRWFVSSLNARRMEFLQELNVYPHLVFLSLRSPNTLISKRQRLRHREFLFQKERPLRR